MWIITFRKHSAQVPFCLPSANLSLLSRDLAAFWDCRVVSKESVEVAVTLNQIRP